MLTLNRLTQPRAETIAASVTTPPVPVTVTDGWRGATSVVFAGGTTADGAPVFAAGVRGASEMAVARECGEIAKLLERDHGRSDKLIMRSKQMGWT